MARVRRIYVHNFGNKTAWYDNHLFDLTNDRDGNHHTNAIFNIENGGGKTSLLAFILSCFDPRQDRWLQHRQKASHKFTDYFSHDGLTAYIAMEWERVGRILVIGQAVSLQDGGREVERRFFAYEGTIEDLPLPVPGTLAVSQSLRMADFQKWLSTGKEQHSDFYYTRHQEEWISHLSDERKIDLALLRMQVDFNSVEGGSDEGFLKFSSEQEFLHKFFALTLDNVRAEGVLRNVEQATEHMRSRPRYQASLEQLGRLSHHFNKFVELADCMDESRKRYEDAQQSVASVAKGALERSKQEEALASALNQDASRKEEDAKASHDSCIKHRKESKMLQRALHERKAKTSKTASDTARREHERNQARLRLLQAAQLHWEVRAIVERIDKIQSDIKAAQEGLLPFLDRAQTSGSLLSCEIGRHLEALDAQRSDDAKKEEAARTRISNIEQETKSASEQLNEISRREGGLATFIEEAGRQKKRLTDGGILAADDETSNVAIEREREKMRAAESKKNELLTQSQELDAQAQALDREAAEKKSAMLEMQRVLSDVQRRLSEGRSLEQSLRGIAILRDVAGSTDVNIDSPALLQMLQRNIEKAGEDIASFTSRINAANERLANFDETGLDYYDPDVYEVVEQLVQAGIKSAKPSNIYLADSVKDADHARILVQSDPARFLGVTITSDRDWERVQQVASSLRCALSRPVTLTPSTIEEAHLGVDRVVVMPEEDTAYNREAAASVQERLQKEIDQYWNTLEKIKAWHHKATGVQVELDRWNRDYGSTRLHGWEDEERRTVHSMKEAQDRAEQCLKDARENREKAASLRAAADEQQKTMSQCDVHLRQLVSYRDSHELPLPAKIKEQQQLQQKRETLSESIAALDKEKSEREHERGLAHDRVLACDQQKAALDGERRKIRHLREDRYDAAQELAQRSYTLEHLRKEYEDAVKDHDKKADDIAPVLKERTDGLLQQKSQLEVRLQEFRDITPAEMDAVDRSMDFDAVIRAQRCAVEHSQITMTQADGEAKAQATLLENYLRENRDAPAPSQDTMEMAEEQIVELIQQACDAADQEQQNEATARKEVAAMREKAKEHQSFAKRLSPWYQSLTIHLPDGDIQDVEADEVGVDIEKFENRCKELIGNLGKLRNAKENAEKSATSRFRIVQSIAGSDEFKKVEPELGYNIAESDFSTACANRTLWANKIEDNIETTRYALQELDPEFQSCATEVFDLVQHGATILARACAQKMPRGASYVAGKPVLKMRAALARVSTDMRREIVNKYLNDVLVGIEHPKTGAAIVAQCLRRYSDRGTLGLQVLKMEPNEDEQYQPIDNFKGSGGQSAVFAMFLYLIISGIRSEERGTTSGDRGVPLFLDNPFAKVQTFALVEAQRLLAEAIGVQVVAFAARNESNNLEGFGRLICLRKAGINSITGRGHLEKASVAFSREVALE
ncbi:MAG: hypothetical protein IKZ87_01475 [Actinomycetaceae bacterium]|nr:hypothetical protein [Actinomycetaceae bacterium]